MGEMQHDWTVDPVYGCHLWNGKLGNNGRPIVWRGRKPSSAYQLRYEAEVGNVPVDHVLDHLCRRIVCVRPLHLEPVTRHENELRKSWPYRCKRTHCARGHELATALVTPEGGRLCRKCEEEAS
jgi:hypothetical protein